MKNGLRGLKNWISPTANGAKKPSKIILRDFLAIDRTRLANQRTLLSFLRTSLYLFVTALAVMKVNFFSELKYLGNVFIVLSLITALVGIINYFMMRKKIEKHYNEPPNHISEN